ncbi:MAG TPA: cytochrome P450 [Polyangia bacterium]|nr:cytochrome P450 [Polyangia bacterium]
MSSAVARVPTGPRGGLVLGSLRAFRDDPLRFLVETARDHRPAARFQLGRIDARLFSQPSGIKRILQDNNENYGRQTRSHAALRATLGNGLITSDGDFWRRQRRISQPAFHKQRIAGFGGAMTTAAEQLIDRWRPLAARGEALDIFPELLGLTLKILGRSLFSLELGGAAAAVGEGLDVVLHHTMETINSILPVPEALPTPANRRFKAAIRALDAVVLDLIQKRRQSPGGNDLLSMLVESRDAESGEGMTDRQLRDEVMTLMLAGHETTSVTLSWAFTFLSRHPAVRRTLEEELAAVLGGRAAGLEDLPRLRYTRMVLEETMRLLPPAWVVTRSAVADDEVDGFFVPAGSLVIVSPYVTHRDPALWPNPEGFDPQRFESTEQPRYAYFPFGGGPHLCIGAGFAMMEAQIVLATVAQHLRLDLLPGHPVEVEPLVTLRPRHGIRMTLHPRS